MNIYSPNSHIVDLRDIELRAAADGRPENDSSNKTTKHQVSPFTNQLLQQSQVNSYTQQTNAQNEPHMNLLFRDDDDDDGSPEASTSFQIPITPHLNRYSHSGQVPSCDAVRPSSLKHVTAEDINVTASPILRGSERKQPTNIFDNNREPDILTPIKTLNFNIDDSDDNHDDDDEEFSENHVVKLKQTMKSVTSTPDPKSLEKRHKFMTKSHPEPAESPILHIDDTDLMKFGSEKSDKMSTSFISDIDDMERVRGHLHNMLKLSDDALNGTKQSNAQSIRESLQHENRRYIQQSDQQNPSLNLFMGVKPLSSLLAPPQSTRYQADLTLVAENNVVKEALEKERYRRKHCEDHIQKLNTKMLEMQQELAVAVATDHRKDTMIEQLDRQLAKVVEGWKKRETEKETLITRLRNDKNKSDAELHTQQQMLQKFELELTLTVEDLKTEKDLANSCVTQLRQQVSTITEELSNTTALLTSERERCDIIQAEWEKARDSRDVARDDIQTLNEQLVQERRSCDKKEQDLLDKLDMLTRQKEADLEEERMKTHVESRRADELKAEVTRSDSECKSLEMEIHCCRTEMENLKVAMALMEAKHENNVRRLEADLRTELEQQTADKILELHKKSELTEKQTQESHNSHLRELTQQHAQEVQGLRDEVHQKDDALRRLRVDFDEKMSQTQAEIQDLQSQNTRLQTQRSEALTKMQTLMQSQWHETLSLLSSPQKQPTRTTAPNFSHQLKSNDEIAHSHEPISNNPAYYSTNHNSNSHMEHSSLTNQNSHHIDPSAVQNSPHSQSKTLISQSHLAVSMPTNSNFVQYSDDNFSPLSALKRLNFHADIFQAENVNNIAGQNANTSQMSSHTSHSVETDQFHWNLAENPSNYAQNNEQNPSNLLINKQSLQNITEIKPNCDTKYVHFSENDIFNTTEIPLADNRYEYSRSNVNQTSLVDEIHDYSRLNPSSHLNSSAINASQYTIHNTKLLPPTTTVATAMRLPQQSDWLLSNDGDTSRVTVETVDVRNLDEEDGVFSPMPQFSDDESTVAEREADDAIFHELRPRLLQFSPPVKQTRSVDNSIINDSVRLNESHDEATRQAELSHYIHMLLQKSPVSVTTNESPGRDQPVDDQIPTINSSAHITNDASLVNIQGTTADDKLAEVSRLLGLYGGGSQTTVGTEAGSPSAVDILAMIKDIHESRTTIKSQSSPKTKPNTRLTLAQQNRKVKKVTPAPTNKVNSSLTNPTTSQHEKPTRLLNTTKTTRKPAPSGGKNTAWK